MRIPRSTARVRLSVLLSIGLLLGLAGCSDSGSAGTPRSPVVDGTLATSDSGLLAMTVPPSWLDETASMRNLNPLTHVTYEFVWVLDGSMMGRSSSTVILGSFDSVSVSSAEFANVLFAATLDTYPEADSVERSTFTTADGITFERQDLTASDLRATDYVVALVAVVDDTPIMITITLHNDAVHLLETVLDSVATLVVQ